MEGINEERESGFEVDAVGGKDDRGARWDAGGQGLPPIEDAGGDKGGEIVEFDICFHQREHWELICDVDGR